MGLFDSYFDPGQFQDSGGLLGRLLSLQQQQSQYQSGPGFNAQAESANASPQPAALPMPAPRPTLPQTPDERPRQTIAVGDYQMPQLGGADTSQGVQQQPGIGDRLSAGFQSWAHTPVGNPFAALANGVSAFSSGPRSDPAVQRISTSETDATGNPTPDPHARYQALRPLLGDRNAMLAIVHPEFGRVLIAQALAGQTKPGDSSDVDPADSDQLGLGHDTNATVGGQPRGLEPPIAASKPLGHAPRSARGGGRSNMPGALRLPKTQSHWGNGNGR